MTDERDARLDAVNERLGALTAQIKAMSEVSVGESLIRLEARIVAIEVMLKSIAPVAKDWSATRERSLGFIAGVAFASSLAGVGLFTAIQRLFGG